MANTLIKIVFPKVHYARPSHWIADHWNEEHTTQLKHNFYQLHSIIHSPHVFHPKSCHWNSFNYTVLKSMIHSYIRDRNAFVAMRWYNSTNQNREALFWYSVHNYKKLYQQWDEHLIMQHVTATKWLTCKCPIPDLHDFMTKLTESRNTNDTYS